MSRVTGGRGRAASALLAVLMMLVALAVLVVPAVATAGVRSAADVRSAVGARTVGATATDADRALPVATRWASPVPGPPVVVHGFDPPDVPWARGHRGVDLAAAVGQEVLTPADGHVSFVGVVVDRGVLTVTHRDGLRSSFEPVASSLAVGDLVRQGDEVATVDSVPGHCAPAACLHWGVREGEQYLDPMVVLRGGPVVLLPLSPARLSAARLSPARPG